MSDLDLKLAEYGADVESRLRAITLDEVRERAIAGEVRAPAVSSDGQSQEQVVRTPRRVHRAVWVAVAAGLFVFALFIPSLFRTEEPDVIDDSIPTVTTLLSSTSTVPATTASDHLAMWTEDLDFLVESLESVHPNPYWRVGAAEFETQLAAIRAAIPDSTDNEIEYELVRLMAQIDGHTMVNVDVGPVAYRRAALLTYEFSDGLFVVQSIHQGMVGRRLAQVDFHGIEQVSEAAAGYVSYDNDQTIRSRVPAYLAMDGLLVDSGVTSRAETVYTFRGLSSGSTMVVMPTLSADGWKTFTVGGLEGWADPWSGVPAGFGQVSGEGWERSLWWRSLPGSDAVYVGFNSMNADSAPVVADLEERLAGDPVDRIVVDLRRNQGGDLEGSVPLVDFLLEQAADGVTVVCLIGRNTFGEAVGFVAGIEEQVTLVGEGTGGSPNFFGDPVAVTLPHSGVEVLISSEYFEFGGPGDTRVMIEPDIEVAVSSDDYFAGVDPVLDAALGYQAG